MIRALCLLLLSLTLGGCSTVSHWGQAAGGHLALLNAAKPVDDWLADPTTNPALAQRLRLAQQMREFAVRSLALPDSNSYRRYAELGRDAAVWNVVAAPPYGLELKTWCYPLMGCAGYQGWFDRNRALAQADALTASGWESQVLPVPAYSTLGWSNWLGGDPLLNTFIAWPEGELAGLIFHELAHQKVYSSDDTGFNEAYASAVELLGARAWLADRPDAARVFEEGRTRRAAFLRLAREGRARLLEAYAGPEMLRPQAKALVMAALRERAPREAPGYEGWFARANNASFALLNAYDELVPAFERLFQQEGGDWPRFHAAVARLAALPAAQRRERLLVGTRPSDVTLGGPTRSTPDEPDPAPRQAR